MSAVQARAVMARIAVEDIPQEMRAEPRWLVWKYETRPNPNTGEIKRTKVPYLARAPRHKADVTNPTDRGAFAQALAACEHGDCDGLGFALGDGWAGIDLDHVVNLETGEIAVWAVSEIRAINTYTEWSPSGEGIHILLHGTLPGNAGRKRGYIESYSAKRFLTVTGQHLPDTPRTVEARQDALDTFYARHFADQSTHTASGRPEADEPLDDEALIRKARDAKDGGKFTALWEGDTSGYNSPSEAVAALLFMLAFWSRKNAAQMDRLFRRSGLMRMSTKWDTSRGDTTWGAREVASAIAKSGDVYHRPQPTTEAFGNTTAGSTGGEKSAKSERMGAQSPDEDDSSLNSLLSQPLYPDPPRPEAFSGLVGDLVAIVGPHTEADPVAILVQFLVAYGNAIGRTANFTAEADSHHANLFACLVGNTAKGRKGSSWGQVVSRFQAVDEQWLTNHVAGGLSSGEGLIHALRDVPEGDEALDKEPLLADKRLLIQQGEFASVLKMLTREGNILSDILREAWDGVTLRVLTKLSPEKATRAHISVIGHITRDELTRHLSATEAGNGFGNRFLWVCVKRSKLLPDGGNIASVDFSDVNSRLTRTSSDLG